MGKLDEAKRRALLDRTVTVVLEMRAMYLAGGANPLEHWKQVENRLRMAARTTASVAEWVTEMQKRLQIEAPSSKLSTSILELVEESACIPSPAFLDLVEREYGYIMAIARAEADDRREQRKGES